MLTGAARWIAMWAGYMLIFVAVGAIITMIASELDSRAEKFSDMEGLGWWGMPMLFFWAACVVAAVAFIILNFNVPGLLNTLVIFISGMFLGSGAVFLTAMVYHR
jgi:hypothetical protein